MMALSRKVGSAADRKVMSVRPAFHRSPPSPARRSRAGIGHGIGEAGEEAIAFDPLSIALDAIRDGGAPLDPAVRSDFERGFARDFSHVRVYTGGRADASARAVSSTAYTVGPNVVFRSGAFAPGTDQGRRLLAHELTHVVQQTGLGGIPRDGATEPSGLAVSQPHDRAEREADRVAGAWGHPEAGRAVAAASAPGQTLHRESEKSSGGAAPVKTERPGGTLFATDASGKALPPSLDDLSQGGVKDCFLFAAMAAIVNTNPQQIVNMIKDNGDGTFTVTFKGIGFFSSAKQTVSAVSR